MIIGVLLDCCLCSLCYMCGSSLRPIVNVTSLILTLMMLLHNLLCYFCYHHMSSCFFSSSMFFFRFKVLYNYNMLTIFILKILTFHFASSVLSQVWVQVGRVLLSNIFPQQATKNTGLLLSWSIIINTSILCVSFFSMCTTDTGESGKSTSIKRIRIIATTGYREH